MPLALTFVYRLGDRRIFVVHLSHVFSSVVLYTIYLICVYLLSCFYYNCYICINETFLLLNYIYNTRQFKMCLSSSTSSV